MPRQKDKQELIDELVARILGERNALADDIAAQKVDVSKQSSAMQSRYDSFREEGQYKVGALSKRLEDLDRQISLSKLFSNVTRRTDKVQGGSLVHLLGETGDQLHYLLLPFSPGAVVQFNEYPVTVVTPASDVGQKLIGAKPSATITISDAPYVVRGIE